MFVTLFMIFLFVFGVIVVVQGSVSLNQKSKSVQRFEISVPVEYKKKRSFVDEVMAIDIETTGLKPGLHEIIEISAVHVREEIIIQEFHSYIKPTHPIPAEITKINNITNTMVKDAPIISEVLPEFKKFIGEHVIVAHNAPFDLRFVIAELSQLGISFDNQVFCTLSGSRKLLPNIRNHKLDTIAKHFKIQNKQAHSASGDAQTCGLIYFKLKHLNKTLEAS